MTQYSLSKSERIKSRKIVETLFSKGDSLFVHPLKLVYTAVPKSVGDQPILFGATVPKRIFKTAVSRNRIKRLIREAYRLSLPHTVELVADADQAYALMFIYVHKSECTQAQISACMERLLKKFNKVISQG